MGLLTDLFVGSIDQAQSYDSISPSNVERAQFSGLTNLEFETLRAILADEEWDVERHALELVSETDETWTFRFPADYVRRLQELDSETMNRAASRWAATEEIACPPSEILPVIESLVGLAKSATANGQDLFVWTSL